MSSSLILQNLKRLRNLVQKKPSLSLRKDSLIFHNFHDGSPYHLKKYPYLPRSCTSITSRIINNILGIDQTKRFPLDRLISTNKFLILRLTMKNQILRNKNLPGISPPHQHRMHPKEKMIPQRLNPIPMLILRQTIR